MLGQGSGKGRVRWWLGRSGEGGVGGGRENQVGQGCSWERYTVAGEVVPRGAYSIWARLLCKINVYTPGVHPFLKLAQKTESYCREGKENEAPAGGTWSAYPGITDTRA